MRALIKENLYELDIHTLHRNLDAGELRMNSIGRVRLRAMLPLLTDPYRRNRHTGAFIVIDESTNRTVGAGVITEN